MVPRTTRQTNDTPVSAKLYLALELSSAEWKLGFTIGLGQAPRLRSMKARNLEGLKHEIDLAKERFGLAREADVFSCYEAGRDGFWLHRFLQFNPFPKLFSIWSISLTKARFCRVPSHGFT